MIGLSMQLYDRTRDGRPVYGRCCSPRDLHDARAVADRLGIPFFVLNLEEEFQREVIGGFLSEYRAGRTPVPCVQCNSGPKFRHLAGRALMLGAKSVATGHYARVRSDPATGRVQLLRARDLSRDQSYFLFDLSQAQLGLAVFPLGEMRKDEVRRLAARRDLPNADKPDSQDICFVPDGDYREFVRRETGDTGPPGEMVDAEGRVRGRHTGLAGYTIGQRRGLGLASGRPLYVIGLDPRTNRVIVGEDRQQYRDVLVADHVNWVSIRRPDGPIEAVARIRSTHRGAPAVIEALAEDRMRVVFHEPQRAITPGQAVVLYRDEQLLAGGFIREVS
ncbi:MAG: tRNA 2-thiouridine(34) synthase MnmA [Acidobacteria bacterium 13_1_40CM_4_69_4]|nr:MAG: tRNA 2-thiouridine(34) synthase MnmA [Acidobacteria bacterium 13_1_40CM_4_69_4]